jgi:hypothetical protein
MESGSLAGHQVAEILRTLGRQRATGRLRVARNSQEANVWLRDGKVYTAQAPEARARLGDRLVGAGALDQSQLEQALDVQRSAPERRRIGELLVERGVIDRETLRTYVQAQILDSVTAALSWDTGRWTFAPGDEQAEDAPLDMSLENLLMDASRRLEEWEVVRGELGSLDAVVDFSPRQTGAEVALTPDEWSLLTHIDGAASVAEIADYAGYGQFETARIVYGLMTAGIVDVVPDGEEPAEADRDSLLSEFAGLDRNDHAPRRVVRERLEQPVRRTPLPPPSVPQRRRLLDRFRRR